MITAIRRMFSSAVGKVLALGFLVFIGLAFALTDVSNIGNFSGVAGGDVANVGSKGIGVGELRQQVQRSYEQARQQQPTLTLAAFVESGGLDNALKTMIEARAFTLYARELGFAASKRQIDGRIADTPQFFGVAGKFDQAAYARFLQQQGLSDAEVREDFERQILFEQIISPIASVPAVSPSLARPYAALLLEERKGSATFIAASALAPTTTPDDKTLATFLTQNRVRYSLPERRVLRYAVFDRSAVPVAPVTDAEIAKAFKDNAARYAASETRRLAQVIAPTRAAADKIAAAARSGQSLDAAALANGLSSSFTQPLSQGAFASQSSAATAKSVFAAARGAIVGPVEAPLGFAVYRVAEVNVIPARTLAQATPELRQQLGATKAQEAMVTFYNSVQDAVNNGASVEEIAAERKLKLVETPAILPSGRAPDQAGFALPAILAPMVNQAFQGATEGEGQLATLEQNQSFAVFDVKQIVASAPPPLAQIKDTLIADWRLAQGHRAARDKARAIVKAVEAGQPLSAVATGTGVGAVQTIGGTRAQLARDGRRVPPEVALLFSMSANSVKTLEIPGNRGWMVLSLGALPRPDPAAVDQARVNAVARPLAGAFGNELVAQLIADAKARVGVTINTDAVNQLKREMSGQSPVG
ncbi:MAG: SurA N-terminal domain-containing protein [Sphingopyxis sp.]|nr:SurA N-terminal domain-containing protein [Sphingopyxis sp.]